MKDPDDIRLNPFAGLRVAVTGGTSGLGLALVRELLDRGAQVAFVARGREGVERVAREHSAAHGIVGDVSKKNDIHPIAIQIVGEFLATFQKYPPSQASGTLSVEKALSMLEEGTLKN